MPTIKKPNEHFDATTYTGNGGTLSVTNAGGFQPDLVWIKDRTSGTNYHAWFDSIRGTNNRIFSNATDTQDTTAATLTAFNSNGFTLGSQEGQNASGNSLVAWQWRAGQGTTTVNTSGTISSNVSVNATAGFSVVTYTGNGTTGATIGHGLGVAPKFIIIKGRSTAFDWAVYHASLGNQTVIRLNTTAVAETAGATFWNSTTPSSTVVTLGSWSELNGSGATQVAYCWAEVEGFSKFGSYAGNSSTDGPFIYTGFKPRWILVKKYAGGTASNWHLHDTARDTYNSSNSILIPDSSGAESVSSGFAFDILSNGFKLRTSDGSTNGSTLSYIYAAFAEAPFKYSNAR
jgi:hypothetical protein